MFKSLGTEMERTISERRSPLMELERLWRKVKAEAAQAGTHVVVPMMQHQIMIQERNTMTEVVNLTSQDALIQLLVTTTQKLQLTILHACNWMNAEFAAVKASLKAHVTAKETYWTSAAFAAVTASLKAHAIAKETYWTSAAFVAVTASLKARVTAMAHCLQMVMTAAVLV
jgi:hypothetical protein